MTGGIVLGIRLGFHNHAPKQAAIVLAFHQTATDQVRSDHLCGSAEKELREGWEILGDELDGYGRGFDRQTTVILAKRGYT